MEGSRYSVALDDRFTSSSTASSNSNNDTVAQNTFLPRLLYRNVSDVGVGISDTITNNNLSLSQRYASLGTSISLSTFLFSSWCCHETHEH